MLLREFFSRAKRAQANRQKGAVVPRELAWLEIDDLSIGREADEISSNSIIFVRLSTLTSRDFTIWRARWHRILGGHNRDLGVGEPPLLDSMARETKTWRTLRGFRYRTSHRKTED